MADSSLVGNEPGTIRSGVTLGQPGALLHQTRTAAGFNGSNGLIVDTTPVTNPGTFSTALWFKTSTTTGGKLVGFGNQSSGTSDNYDRHTYMLDTGQLRFGVWTGAENLITSPASYNDGKWHMLVSSQSTTDGMKMYVDGQLVGTNPQTSAQDYTGYWRIGGDTVWGGSSSQFFNGNIDEAAVFKSALSASQVADMYAKGTQNASPVARFTVAKNDLDVSVNGSTSTDSDGTIADYAWNFGDGSTQHAATPTATHTYAAGGTYTITLTTTDSDGATGVETHDVTVAPNAPPVPLFSTSVAKWTVSGTSQSTDDSGITSYVWDFGEVAGR